MPLSKLIFLSIGLLFHLSTISPENKTAGNHPFYVSVTQIEENSKEKIGEISCRIFADDFEKTLRMHYKEPIDLLNPSDKKAMNRIVNDYVGKHLKISIDGKVQPLQFIGFEKNEEAIECYFQINDFSVNKNISVFNDLLFEYKREQTNIVHVTVKGKRKSRQLANPEASVSFDF